MDEPNSRGALVQERVKDRSFIVKAAYAETSALLWGIVAAVLTLSLPAQGQVYSPSLPLVVNIDHALFKIDSSHSYLEIYFAIHPPLVTLEKKNGSYRGGLLFRAVLKSRSDGKAVVDTKSIFPVEVRDTNDVSFAKTLVSVSTFVVPTGHYTFEVKAVDTTAAERIDTLRSDLMVETYRQTGTASDIQLCSNIMNAGSDSSAFYKNGLVLIPNPSRVFGVTNHPVLFYYVELYNMNTDDSVTVSAKIVRGDGNGVREAVKKRVFKGPDAVEAGMINVSSIESGKYRLRISIQEESGSEATMSEKIFFVYNPHIKSAEPTAADMLSGELAGLTEEELDTEFAQALYVATSQDITLYGQLGSANAKRQFLASFWADVEAGKPGKIVIARRDYLHRVSIAAQRFRSFARPGWKTDRGRVLVLYSEPDQIDRVQSSDYGKPYETWHYYQIENGVQFVFIDRTGFGEYTLVHSTKRGELQDDNWQRLLQ